MTMTMMAIERENRVGGNKEVGENGGFRFPHGLILLQVAGYDVGEGPT